MPYIEEYDDQVDGVSAIKYKDAAGNTITVTVTPVTLKREIAEARRILGEKLHIDVVMEE